MASFFGSDAERVAEYRKLAEKGFADASTAADVTVRATLIDIANSYLKLAQHLESRALARALQPKPRTDRQKPVALDDDH